MNTKERISKALDDLNLALSDAFKERMIVRVSIKEIDYNFTNGKFPYVQVSAKSIQEEKL